MSLDATTGAWTFTLLKPLDHETQNGTANDNTENDLLLQFGNLIQATDFDGDTVTAPATAFEITVDDDMPRYVAQATSTGTVDEDFVTNGINDDAQPGDVPGGSATATGSVTGLFKSGADIPLTYGFNTGGSGPAGLTSGGVAVTYTITSTLITASAGAGNTVFTLSLDATQSARTFTLVSRWIIRQ